MSTLSLTIANYNYSSWSLRPWLFIQHHQIPVEVVRLTLFSDEMREELSNKFSNFKVPVLQEGDIEIWDSLAILEYLHEYSADINGWPKAKKARAVARSICAEMHSSFSRVRRELPMNCRKSFPGFPHSEGVLKDVKRIEDIWTYCRSEFGADGPWLFGDFSIADCMYAPVMLRFRSYEIFLNNVCTEYCATLLNHPAITQWVKLAKHETEYVAEDEVDWPSKEI